MFFRPTHCTFTIVSYDRFNIIITTPARGSQAHNRNRPRTNVPRNTAAAPESHAIQCANVLQEAVSDPRHYKFGFVPGYDPKQNFEKQLCQVYPDVSSSMSCCKCTITTRVSIAALTGRWVVLKTEVDVLLDSEAKAARVGEVLALKLVLLHLKPSLKDLQRLVSADLSYIQYRERQKTHCCIMHQVGCTYLN